MTERVRVWRAWDHEWVAECDTHGEVHWGGRWIGAMAAAWGHIAMHHPRPQRRIVFPEPAGQISGWDTLSWLLTNRQTP